ncbi:MAG: SIMPL domain-containing protein [Rhodobacteraceae bacterium]|nr:SIMPL domain-containing protein [Paracoccaceae bacterium]
MNKAFPTIIFPALGVLLVATLFFSGPARAENFQRQINVTGEGQVAVDPDMATITLGVAYEAKTARSALDATSKATARVLQRLADLGVAPRDMQTSRLSLNPIRPDRSASKADETGFTASNSVHVRLRDLASLGLVLDAIADEGGNSFSGLRFSVQDPGPLMNTARQRAVGDAMAKARLLTEAANVTLGAVLSMSENGGGRPQMMEMSAARGGAVPIAAGEVIVSASVTMVFAIED